MSFYHRAISGKAFIFSASQTVRLYGGYMALLLFVLWAAALGLQILDYVTTVQALSHGYVEGNPLMRWLFSKVGQPVAAFLGAVVSSVAFALWTAYSPVAGAVFAAILVAFECAFMLPRAVKLLRKYGLK